MSDTSGVHKSSVIYCSALLLRRANDSSRPDRRTALQLSSFAPEVLKLHSVFFSFPLPSRDRLRSRNRRRRLPRSKAGSRCARSLARSSLLSSPVE